MYIIYLVKYVLCKTKINLMTFSAIVNRSELPLRFNVGIVVM